MISPSTSSFISHPPLFVPVQVFDHPSASAIAAHITALLTAASGPAASATAPEGDPGAPAPGRPSRTLGDRGRRQHREPPSRLAPSRPTLLPEAPVQPVQYSVVLQQVQAVVRAVLGTSEALVPDAPLMSLGLDSLGAVELRNSLEAALGVTLPTTLVGEWVKAGDLCALGMALGFNIPALVPSLATGIRLPLCISHRPVRHLPS